MKQPSDSPFLDWFLSHGGKVHPALRICSHPGNSFVRTTEDIPSKTVIVAVPWSIVITAERCRKSELRRFYSKHEQLFYSDNTDDSEYNTIACFLVLERLKGKASFFYQYFRSIGSTQNMMDWGIQVVSADSLRLLEESQFFRDDLEKVCKKILKAFLDEPLFRYFKGPDLLSTIKWAFSVVMTRCFGYCTPSICLVPFADLFNHSHHAGQHYIVSPSLELEPKWGYAIKGKSYQMRLVDERLGGSQRREVEQFLSDSQDNDSQDDQIQQREVQFCRYKQHQMAQSLYAKESAALEGRPLDISVAAVAQVELIESLEERQDSMTPQEFQKCKDELLQNFKKRSQQPAPQTVPTQAQLLEDEIDNEEFQWAQKVDDIYFIVTTYQSVKAGQEIFVCYGRRTNQFLLMWYGFAYQNNLYDSVSFRLHPFDTGQPAQKQLQNCIFEGYYGGYGMIHGFKHYNQPILKDELTRQFRLKLNKFPFQLLQFLRLWAMSFYKEDDLYRLQITIPVSFTFEREVLNYLKKILLVKRSMFTTSLEQDEAFLKEGKKGHVYYCVMFRKQQKKILDSNIQLSNRALEELQAGERGDWSKLSSEYGEELLKNQKLLQIWSKLKKMK